MGVSGKQFEIFTTMDSAGRCRSVRGCFFGSIQTFFWFGFWVLPFCQRPHSSFSSAPHKERGGGGAPECGIRIKSLLLKVFASMFIGRFPLQYSNPPFGPPQPSQRPYPVSLRGDGPRARRDAADDERDPLRRRRRLRLSAHRPAGTGGGVLNQCNRNYLFSCTGYLSK